MQVNIPTSRFTNSKSSSGSKSKNKKISDKKEKYGRYLAKIYLNDNNKWIDVNKLLIDKGLAVEYIP
jgi:endonuclease YncB( thermonuclease family)